MRKKLFKYIGANREEYLRKIYAHHPKNHLEMITDEVFGGTGGWTFFKPKGIMEIYNDYDEGVSAILWCLVNEFERFCFRLQYANHSESILKWFGDYNPKTKLDLAVKTIYEVHHRYGGCNTGIKRWKKIDGWKGRSEFPLFNFELFDTWSKRFAKVQILTEDFESHIKRYDAPNIFFFCDPPFTVTKSGGNRYYGLNFSEEDHYRLSEVLSNIKGKVLITYNDDPLIYEIYKNFHIKPIQVQYHVGTSLGKYYVELLIANYPIKKQTKLDVYLPIKGEIMS